jgi:hypothetical protein
MHQGVNRFQVTFVNRHGRRFRGRMGAEIYELCGKGLYSLPDLHRDRGRQHEQLEVEDDVTS